MLLSLSQLDRDLFILTCGGQPVRQEIHAIYLRERILSMTQHIAHIDMKAISLPLDLSDILLVKTSSSAALGNWCCNSTKQTTIRIASVLSDLGFPSC